MIKRYREKHFVTGYRPYIVLDFFFFSFSSFLLSVSHSISFSPSLGSDSHVMNLLETTGLRFNLSYLHAHPELPD